MAQNIYSREEEVPQSQKLKKKKKKKISPLKRKDEDNDLGIKEDGTNRVDDAFNFNPYLL